jgi:hypothetical protein
VNIDPARGDHGSDRESGAATGINRANLLHIFQEIFKSSVICSEDQQP